MAHPVGHGLDQDRPPLLHAHLPRCLASIENGQEIVAVNTDSMHTIPGSAAHDAVPSELVLDGSADRIAVVAAEEDDRCLGGKEGGREGGKVGEVHVCLCMLGGGKRGRDRRRDGGRVRGMCTDIVPATWPQS